MNQIINNKMGRALKESAVVHFKFTLNGELVRPGDAGYETARKVWNGMINKHPSLIAFCADESDVIKAVDFARANYLLAAVRSGGHNVAGNSVCDGGMIIDLSRIKTVEVDALGRTVEAGAGLNLGELDRATHAYGLATPLGIVTKTGIAGLTLGGGIGWLIRKYGLTCDNLLSVNIVTADGRLLKADNSENSDLFWGVRGGGGNFGIVTKFKYKLHPVKEVFGGTVDYHADNAKDIFRSYRDYVLNAPDELTTMLAFLVAAPQYMPLNTNNKHLVAIHGCWSGLPERGEEVLKPLRELGPKASDTFKVMPFTDLQSMLDSGAPSGLLNYWKSSYLDNLNDDVIETVLDHVSRIPSTLTQLHIQHMQGAAGRVEEGMTAFSNRNASYILNIVSKWTDSADSEKNIIWTRDFANALKPFSTGSYVNFIADDVSEKIQTVYTPENYKRLVALKNKYDPSNFFSLNQNIKPVK